jgi:glycine/D-amino acid oxidase-like deaminating enzyme
MSGHRLRGFPSKAPDTRERLSIEFDGQAIEARAGETVLAALVAGGYSAQCIGKDGAPRGVFCGMGVCHDCLVFIDGKASQRACLAKVRDGQKVMSQNGGAFDIGPNIRDLASLPQAELPVDRFDLVIVGAGPGGLSAAAAAARGGIRSLVLDERPAPGGQYFKQPSHGLDARPADAQFSDGARLIENVRNAGSEIRSDTLVWGAELHADGCIGLSVLTGGVAGAVVARQLIIATGAYERPLPIPGWTLPGVMTTGAMQTLARSYGVAAGKRVLIAGNGPLNLQVAIELITGGVDVVAVAEAAPHPLTRPGAAAKLATSNPALARAGLSMALRLKRSRVPLLHGHILSEVTGDVRAKRATLSRLGDAGTPDRRGDRVFEIDAVAMGYGFAPANDLARLLGCRHVLRDRNLVVERDDAGATSVSGVRVVGEAGSFGGAPIAMAQGTRAGEAAASALGRSVAPNHKTLRSLSRHRTFQEALWSLYSAKIPKLALAAPETPICRCEGITRATLERVAQERDVKDVSTLKRLTRAGMGRCQGRYCAPWLHEIIGDRAPLSELALFAPQAPLRPVPVASLAAAKPEWSGHKRALLPDRPVVRDNPLPLREIDTLVIGAGVVGLSTALFLARRGHGVAVVDRSFANAGASGANAGSLHAQLLSFDFGTKAEAGGGPAARTLPFQRDSIKLWQRLEKELGKDFEIRITGGMMLADDEKALRFLDAKAGVEKDHGIECYVIGPNEVHDREPQLTTRIAGASWCPIEGKINPLVATHGILEAVRALGVGVHSGAEVAQIDRQAAGFKIVTNRGDIRAGRVVNAAGAFAARIGSMVGIRVPVFGAPLQMIVTEAAAPMLSCLVAHAERHLSLKQSANGTFVIGGGWTAGLDPVHHHPRPQRTSIEGNLWVAQHVLPSLRKLHVVRTWAAMNINIDGAPIVGEHPAVPGFFNAVTSNGYTLGPIMGQTTAELILDGTTSRDISHFRIDRFA